MFALRMISVGFCLAMTLPGNVSASSPDRTVVRLHCAPKNLSPALRQSLCQQLLQGLMQVVPRAAPRLVAQGQWQPRRAGDISVRLALSAGAGRLLWQQGPDGALRTGPEVPRPAAVSPQGGTIGAFADSLAISIRPMLARSLPGRTLP